MVIRNMKSGRRLAVLALFAILAMSAFGFAAVNTVEDSNAGDGSGDIGAFAVDNISYDLSDTNYGMVESVTFRVLPSADEVDVHFGDPNTFYSCTNTVANQWSCSGFSVSAASMLELHVAAVD